MNFVRFQISTNCLNTQFRLIALTWYFLCYLYFVHAELIILRKTGQIYMAEILKKIGFWNIHGTGFLQVCIFMFKVNPVFKFIQPKFTLESANTSKSDYRANGRTKKQQFSEKFTSGLLSCEGSFRKSKPQVYFFVKIKRREKTYLNQIF